MVEGVPADHMASIAAGYSARTAREFERIRAALDLGWSMAELRGRLRYGHVEPPGTVDYQFPREQFHALPIGGEHSLTEQQIATRVAVGLLAERFGLDDPVPQQGEPASETIRTLAIRLESSLDEAERSGTPVTRPDTYPAGSDVAKAWEAVAGAIYYWDAQIQDGLGVSGELISAYQLGRGLSEAFWALNPDAPAPATRPSLDSTASPPDPASWEFLLGPRRRLMLGTYVTLLEGALTPLSGPAVRGPLARWGALVADDQVRNRSHEALEALRGQLRNWREVLLGSRDPTSFAKHFGLRLALRQALRVMQTLPLETCLASIGIALLAVAGYALGSENTNHSLAILASVLGFFGVTGAGLLAKAKAQAAVLSGRLREAFYRDIVEAQATVLPKGVKS
jgi:hypothetical protein